jgi:hypothetical protein
MDILHRNLTDAIDAKLARKNLPIWRTFIFLSAPHLAHLSIQRFLILTPFWRTLMPLKLNVGANPSIGEPNNGNRGASVNVELEVDSALVSDPGKLQQRIRQHFSLVRSSLAEELNGNGSPGQHNGTQHNPGNGTQASQPKPATQSQIKAIYAITRSQRLDAYQLVRERFNVDKPEELTIKQASQLIDSLKSRQEGS